MDKSVRNEIQKATQAARRLLEQEFRRQLEGDHNVLPDGRVLPEGGAQLDRRQQFLREKIVAAIEHKRAGGMKPIEAVADYVRDAAFTALNRLAALKMLEARGLVPECVSKGEESNGYRDVCKIVPGLALQADGGGYRLFLESLFDELSTEVKVLFDRDDPAALLWPRRQTLLEVLGVLNAAELASVWGEDETIGWVYQYFNSKEERELMRDTKRGGSQAPRNSRELAVRNQFFTPRYVVQFLTDNTLGRIWYEMHAGRTRLVELCQYLVRPAAEEMTPRAKKDPRDLRILDPACGSGHFLLYTFDLLLAIYEEGWEDAEAPQGSLGNTLREEYADIDALRRAAPALIVERNLYGVDIDPRAAQIAALTLWMRAQRAYKDLGIGRDVRPGIHRTNIVVAEPMPGDAAMVDDFAARLNPPLLGDLFRKMVDEMRLAGELGSLIRVDEGIAAEVKKARELYAKQKTVSGFLPGFEPVKKQGEFDLSGISDDGFFHEAEERILDALRTYAESAEGGAHVRRRLFAGDAAQGVALIDLLRTRFDVVLMNPPFGPGSLVAKKEFEKGYPRTKNDVYAAFVERGIQVLHAHGMLGAITSRTGFFLSSFQKWREEILLKEAPPVAVADLGYGVMDSAMVEAAAYCIAKSVEVDGMKTVFLRVLEADNKAADLLSLAADAKSIGNSQRFTVDVKSFTVVPRTPFAYWVSDRVRAIFGELSPVEHDGRVARQGLCTTDDFRWVRLGWESSSKETGAPRLAPFAKGGTFAPYYSDVWLAVRWGTNGRWIKEWKTDQLRLGRTTANNSKCWNESLYFRPGLTWPLRTQSGLALRAMSAGCVFGHKGPAVFVERNDSIVLLGLLAVANSTIFRCLSDLQMAFGSFEVGVIQRTPVPSISDDDQDTIASLASRVWSLKRSFDTGTENSHAFSLPVILQTVGQTLDARGKTWVTRVCERNNQVAGITAKIDEYCFALYGIDEADRRAITAGFGNPTSAGQGEEPETDEDADIDVDESEDNTADTSSLAAELASWGVGVAFGRFDVRLATGGRAMPAEPEPFDPLPVCSPGMLTGEDGLPLTSAPAGYLIAFPENGVLVDDPGHPFDITASAKKVFDVVFGERAESWWGDVAAAIGAADRDLRPWLQRGFFEYHIKRYSKSRRKAPIYWQLATPSASYSVWLYIHRFTRDTLFAVLKDYVTPKRQFEERKLASMGTSEGKSTKERQELENQERFVDELRAFEEEVARVAPLWNPDLDDGVIINFAPLWRLVPQHKPWQKECKECWDKLVAGDYDWAHLSMHLWPERVVPKCRTDRSLAIAHGLEEAFWQEDEKGKWAPKAVDEKEVERIVRERTSPQVKAALKSLLEAPPPVAASRGAGKGRPRKAASKKSGGKS